MRAVLYPRGSRVSNLAVAGRPGEASVAGLEARAVVPPQRGVAESSPALSVSFETLAGARVNSPAMVAEGREPREAEAPTPAGVACVPPANVPENPRITTRELVT